MRKSTDLETAMCNLDCILHLLIVLSLSEDEVRMLQVVFVIKIFIARIGIQSVIKCKETATGISHDIDDVFATTYCYDTKGEGEGCR